MRDGQITAQPDGIVVITSTGSLETGSSGHVVLPSPTSDPSPAPFSGGVFWSVSGGNLAVTEAGRNERLRVRSSGAYGCRVRTSAAAVVPPFTTAAAIDYDSDTITPVGCSWDTTTREWVIATPGLWFIMAGIVVRADGAAFNQVTWYEFGLAINGTIIARTRMHQVGSNITSNAWYYARMATIPYVARLTSGDRVSYRTTGTGVGDSSRGIGPYGGTFLVVRYGS